MNYIFIAFENLHEGIGTGHIARIKKVIKELVSKHGPSIKVKFITNHKTSEKYYQHLLVSNEFEALKELAEIIDTEKIDAVVFDALDYCKDLYILTKQQNIFTVGIDTSSKESELLDTLINPVISNERSHLNGPMYSVHYEASSYKGSNMIVSKKKKKIFICFGGHDHQNHLEKIFKLEIFNSENYEVNVVLSNNTTDAIIREKKTFKILRNPKNFYELLMTSDIALISGGVLLQEALYLGIPSIVLPQYEHQKKAATERKSKGEVLECLNLDSDVQDIENSIKNNVNKLDKHQTVSLAARSSDDGFGLKRLTGILSIFSKLEWDSQFFGKVIYSLNTKSFNETINKKLNKAISKNSIDLVYFLCPATNKTAVNFSVENGFKIVDERLTFLVNRNNFIPHKAIDGFAVQKCTASDKDEVEAIARETIWPSRYYKDDNFCRNDLKNFYGEWITKSIDGKLDDVVLKISSGNELCGFISLKKNGLNFGSIGLIGISNKFQGLGLGTYLVSFGVEYMFQMFNCVAVEVVTQKNNLKACKAYNNVGFRISDESLWMHKWVKK